MGSRGSGIEFDSDIEAYNTEPHRKQNASVVKFETHQKNSPTENYNVVITVFENKNAEITVRSSHRTLMRYSGKLISIEDTE